MSKLTFINEILQDYQNENRNEYSIEDSAIMEKLLQKTKALEYTSFDRKVEKTFMSKEHTIILTKRFLATIDHLLLEEFNKLLDSNSIEWYEKRSSIRKAGYRGKVPFIKLTITHTLHDMIALVHEFFHLTNRKFVNSFYPLTRETLSEFISIYFEKKAILFLEEEGYPLLELNYFRMERFRDTCYTIRRYHFESAIWKVYQKERQITYMNTPRKINKIYCYLKKYTFSPFKKMVYIFGDILSEYVLEEKVEMNIILFLNRTLNDDPIYLALEKIGINFNYILLSSLLTIYQERILEIMASFRQ